MALLLTDEVFVVSAEKWHPGREGGYTTAFVVGVFSSFETAQEHVDELKKKCGVSSILCQKFKIDTVKV